MPWYEYRGGLPVGEPKDRVQVGITSSSLIFTCPGVLGLGRWHYDLDRGDITSARLDDRSKRLEILRRGVVAPIVLQGRPADLRPLYQLAASLATDGNDVEAPPTEFVTALAAGTGRPPAADVNAERRTLGWAPFLRIVLAVLGVVVVFAVSFYAVRRFDAPPEDGETEIAGLELAPVVRGTLTAPTDELPLQQSAVVSQVAATIAQLPQSEGRLLPPDYTRLLLERLASLDRLVVVYNNQMLESKLDDPTWRATARDGGVAIRQEVSALFLLRPPSCLSDVHRALMSALIEFSQATVNVERAIQATEQGRAPDDARATQSAAVNRGSRAVQESSRTVSTIRSTEC